MLAPENQTPRPRPPALMRRSTSKGALLSPDGAPPPPYALEFPSLHEAIEGDMSDPLAATAKIMGIELDATLNISHLEEDVSNKSKAELTDLFLQAERVIKAREQELNVAANLGKTLLETNEALKLRHDALLARLPVMQSSTKTLGGSKIARATAWTNDEDIQSTSATFSRIHSRASSIASMAQGSPAHSRSNSIIGAAPSSSRGHARRISASPSALLALSETNAELIAELTRLHTATDTAQVEGAQRLRRLEREIGGLRAELEATQRTNAELEEKVKEKIDEERKREREERLRRLRGGEEHDSDNNDETSVRDFAPPGSGVEKWDSVPITPRPNHETPHIPSDSEPERPDGGDALSVSVSSMASRAASGYASASGEYAVVAQLYRKIIELQEANAELTARNRTTNMQLSRAEREALEIKNLYEAISEELAVDSSDQDDPSASTIRASSRGSGSFRSKPSSWSLRIRGSSTLDDKRQFKKRSYGSVGSKIFNHGVRGGKNRAPLTDSLFSPPVSTTSSRQHKTPPSVVLFPSSPRVKPKLKLKLKGKAKPQTEQMQLLSPVGSAALHRTVSYGSDSSASSHTSTASSFLATNVARYVRRNRGRRSLGSELGSEFGDDWEGEAPHGHNSLFDDGSIRALSEGEAETGVQADNEEEDPAVAALRDALTPPLAGRLLEQNEHILPVGSLHSSPGDAFHLVARAVTSRPMRWLDSDDQRARGVGPRAGLTYMPSGEDPWETTRYPDIEPATEADEERASVRLRRRNRAIGRIVSTAHSRSSSSAELTSSTSQLQARTDRPSPDLVASIKRTSADILIEFWLFLQFVVVICTFVYTMSRRGPREVLGVPSRRT